MSLRQTHSGLREDLGLLQQACYCAALVEQATEMETPLAGVFELVIGLLRTAPGAAASSDHDLRF